MADPVGPRGADAGSDLPPPPWVTQPMPDAPPQLPPSDAASTPTDPEIPRPDGSWAAAEPAPTTPYFHDVSGYPAPGAQPAPPPLPTYGAPEYGAPAYGDPTYRAPAYGDPAAAPPGYGQSGYPPGTPGYPGYGPSPYGPYAYGTYAPPRNSSLAIASMVCGIIGLVFCQIFCVPALIMGFVARRQIRDSQGTQTGDAFAIAGLVLGGFSALFLVLIILLYAGMFAFTFSGV